jgi:DNA-binding MarR family transcriptional regulator
MTTAISTFFLIQQLNRLIVKRVDELLKPEGSSSRQFLILDMLASHEPCSSAELARKGHMTAQAMGETLKSLQERGLLERTNCALDGRKVLIQRSAAGRQAFVRYNRLVRQSEAAMFSCLRKQDLASIRGGLAMVREIEDTRLGGGD